MTKAEMWLAHNRCQEITTRARLLGGKETNESMKAAHAVFDEYLAMLSDHSVVVSTDTLQDMLGPVGRGPRATGLERPTRTGRALSDDGSLAVAGVN
jgi:hypothetical protein